MTWQQWLIFIVGASLSSLQGQDITGFTQGRCALSSIWQGDREAFVITDNGLLLLHAKDEGIGS